MDNLDELYVPWNNHKITTHSLSKAVAYLGHFVSFGEVWARHTVWRWDQERTPANQRGKAFMRSQDFQEKALDLTLASLKDCVVLSTTASYFSQYQNACLLKSRGFQLLEGRCYKHPGYSMPVLSRLVGSEHPGIPDHYTHWEHIWWKVQGTPGEIGEPTTRPNMNNCGVDALSGLEQIEAHTTDKVQTANTCSLTNRRNYLAVAWLKRGTAFPKGWKRFFSAKDYKLGVNFDSPNLSKVQACPHNFDLKIFEGWNPDFAKWSPA